MAYTVTKFDVWTREINDRAGGLAAALEPLAAAGTDLAFVVARRQPHKPGMGVVFLGGVTGAKSTRAAGGSGLAKSSQIAALRVEETNKPGSCHKMLRLLSEADINLRGLSATVVGKKCVYILAFDGSGDADKAARALRGKK
jgi:hypothetical protein